MVDSSGTTTGRASFYCTRPSRGSSAVWASTPATDSTATCTSYDCGAGTVRWHFGGRFCEATVQVANNGFADRTITDTTGPVTGSTTLRCANSTWQWFGGSCDGKRPCPSGTSTWSGSDGSTCNAARPSGNDTDSHALTNTNPRAQSGSVTVTCNGTTGTWTQSSASCVKSTKCFDNVNASWTIDGNTCTKTYTTPSTGVASGTSTTLQSNAVLAKGTATLSCSNGTWSVSGSTCVRRPAIERCNAVSSKTWTSTRFLDQFGFYQGGVECGAPIAAGIQGTQRILNDTSGSTRGSATFQCNNSNWVKQSGATCRAARWCLSQSNKSWTVGSNTCVSWLRSTSSGNRRVLNDTSGTTRGSATFQCNDGTLRKQSGSTCRAARACARNSSSSWIVGGYTCTGGSISAGSYGTRRTLNDTTGSTRGSAVAVCNDGAWDEASGSTCRAARACARNSSSSWIVGGYTCTGGSISAGSHGTRRTLNDTTGSTRGSAVAVCNDGAWDEASGSTCRAPRGCARNSSSSWIVGGYTCTGGSISAGSYGTRRTLNDTTGSTRGSAVAVCNDGAWDEASGSTCRAPRGCARSWQQWGYQGYGEFVWCSLNIDAAPHETDTGWLRYNSGNTRGIARFTCNDGTWETRPFSCSTYETGGGGP